MDNARQRARRSVRKIRLDGRNRLFRRQHASASHGAQGFARLQLLRCLLKRAAPDDEKQRHDCGEDCAQAHENECEAVFAKSKHSVIAFDFG